MTFVPPDFAVPAVLESADFRLRMLTVHDLVKDYDAVMTSRDHLAGVFGPDSGWPDESLTLEQDLIDLGWHQKEFQTRRSFTYTVMAPDESQCLGCCYLLPSPRPDFDAMAIAWVRHSHRTLDGDLLAALKGWLGTRWPFKRVAFPGRDISWAEWSSPV